MQRTLAAPTTAAKQPKYSGLATATSRTVFVNYSWDARGSTGEVGSFPALPRFHRFDPMFETITFWIIVAWFIAGVWMIAGSFGGPAVTGRGATPVSGSADSR